MCHLISPSSLLTSATLLPAHLSSPRAAGSFQHSWQPSVGHEGTLLTQRRARETNHDCSFAHTGGELWQTVATNVRGALRIDCSMCPRLRPTNKTRLVSSGILQTRSVAQLLLLADCHCCQPVHQLERACACHTPWTDRNDVHQQLDRWAGVQYAAARDAGRGRRRIHGLLTDWH